MANKIKTEIMEMSALSNMLAQKDANVCTFSKHIWIGFMKDTYVSISQTPSQNRKDIFKVTYYEK
jgi:hypothetical protein